MNKLKTAVVGVGALGRHHLRWLSQLPQSDLIGFFETDKEKQEQYSQEYNIKSFDTLDELANEVEAVSIVVPTTAHFDVASQLIDKGVHCLIEKPVTSSVDQARKLIDQAKNKDVKLTVGQIERFNPAVLALEKYEMKPSFIEAHRLAAFDPRGTDVAVILDLMIHDIDLVLKMIGTNVADIQASGVAVISEQIDIANARLTFENGAVSNLTASRISLKPMRKLRIFQNSGYFSLDLAEKQADVYRLSAGNEESDGFSLPLGKSGKNVVYNKYEDNGQDMLGGELSAFLDSIIEKKPVAVSVEQATEALRVALEIERICKENISKHIEGVSI